MNPLVVYHAGCRDGFCSAWAIHLALDGKAEFFPGFHGQAPPDVTGRDVVLVDFSYPLDIIKEIAEKCNSLLILDHHQTAKAALESFSHPKATVVFDMNRSGAGIAWDYYHREERRPWLVDYVEDRDLWRNKLPYTDSVNAYISTLEYDFHLWYGIYLSTSRDEAASQGEAVEAKIAQYVTEVSKNAIRVNFQGYDIPLVNAPQVDISELLNHLAKNEVFSMGWWQRGDGMFSYGLRSIGDFDVSEIAKRFGGGGHKNAAGFQVNQPLIFGEIK